jgi:hypothetical protein
MLDALTLSVHLVRNDLLKYIPACTSLLRRGGDSRRILLHAPGCIDVTNGSKLWKVQPRPKGSSLCTSRFVTACATTTTRYISSSKIFAFVDPVLNGVRSIWRRVSVISARGGCGHYFDQAHPHLWPFAFHVDSLRESRRPKAKNAVECGHSKRPHLCTQKVHALRSFKQGYGGVVPVIGHLSTPKRLFRASNFRRCCAHHSRDMTQHRRKQYALQSSISPQHRDDLEHSGLAWDAAEYPDTRASNAKGETSERSSQSEDNRTTDDRHSGRIP